MCIQYPESFERGCLMAEAALLPDVDYPADDFSRIGTY